MRKCFSKGIVLALGLVLGTVMSGGSSVPEVRADQETQEYPRFSAGDIRGLALTRDGEEIFRISNEPASYKMEFDYWEILNPYDESATVDTEVMYRLFEAVAGLDPQEAAELEDGTDTGIEKSETALTVEFIENRKSAASENAEGEEPAEQGESTEGEEPTEQGESTEDEEPAEQGESTEGEEPAKEGENTERSVTIRIGKEDGDGSVYAAVQGYEEQVYTLSAETVTAIFQLKPFDYILKIPVLFNIETLDRVDIAIGDETYSMKKEERVYRFGKKKVEKEKFTTLYQALMNLSLDSDFDPGAQEETDGDRTEVLRVVFHRNTEDAPDAELVYKTFDETHDILSVNGKERFLVKAEDVEALIGQIEDVF